MSNLKLSRSKPVKSASDHEVWPFISVVVPVRNEARAIANTLVDLLRQSYAQDRFEIIVVDGESTDDTRTIVQKLCQEHANLKLLDNPKRWSMPPAILGFARHRVI